ncbi:MAG: CAP domain-containing protein [Corynebacterium sp.]|nr:CAP domain-containing protein [Corynebacterium sp.]
MNQIQRQVLSFIAAVTTALGGLFGGLNGIADHINAFANGSSAQPASSHVAASADNTAVQVSSAAALNHTNLLLTINAYRASQGLRPVIIHPQLNGIAQGWADHMSRTGVPAHNPNFLNSYPAGWREGAENVHQNWRGVNAQTVVDAWANSPSHRINQADPNFTHVGIGIAYSGDGKAWVVTNYMR